MKEKNVNPSRVSFERQTYHLVGISPLLGSQPANPEIHAAYVASKAPTPEKGKEETDMLPEMPLSEKGATVFTRYPDGSLCLSQHVIKGFLKEALTVLRSQTDITYPRAKVDDLVFISPMYLRLYRGDEMIKEPDTRCERPLRAETMQGPRVGLATSEQIDEGWELTFTVTLVEHTPGAKSKGAQLSWEHIEMALDYGALKGLGQWRNGGHGSFVWNKVGDVFK